MAGSNKLVVFSVLAMEEDFARHTAQQKTADGSNHPVVDENSTICGMTDGEEEEVVSSSGPIRRKKALQKQRAQNTRGTPYNTSTRRAAASAFDLKNFLAMAQGLVKTGWPSTKSFLKAKLAGMSQKAQDALLEIVRTSGHSDFLGEQKYLTEEATLAAIRLALQN